MMVLSKEKRKAIVKKIDDMIDSPWWLEPWDQIPANKGFDYIDEKYGDKIPEKFHDEINAVADAFLADDWAGIIENTTPSLLNDIIDIPGIDEDLEGKWIAYNVQVLFQYILWIANKKHQV